MQPITPIDDFVYLVNHVLLGEEPTIEDFILLVGTLVAFIAFILWCCFPIQPKDGSTHRQFSCKSMHRQQQQQQHQHTNASSTDAVNNATVGSGFLAAGFRVAGGSAAAGNAGNIGFGSARVGGNGGMGNIGNANNSTNINQNINSSNNSSSSNTYSRSPPSSLHNDYIRSGHHCCS